SFVIREGKTRKRREINLSMIQKEISDYIQGKADHCYLFESQKGNRPITTTQAYRILQSAGTYIGRKDIGTHTMRKTFGYHRYKQYRDVAMLQEIFHHSEPGITRRYIGIR